MSQAEAIKLSIDEGKELLEISIDQEMHTGGRN
jgi:hypothetical protein